MAAITSAQTGLWNATSTWTGGVVPVSGDTVTIASGHVITVNGVYTVGADTATAAVAVAGTLKASRSVSSALTLRGNLVNSGNSAQLDYGVAGDLIPSGITADLIINSSASLAVNKYGITFTGGTLFSFGGAPKTGFTTLSAAASSAATSISVSSTTGWVVGDVLAILTTSSTASQRTVATISSISGTGPFNVGLSTGLESAKASGGLVQNLSRNVRVYPASSANPSFVSVVGDGNFTAGGIRFINSQFCIGGRIANNAGLLLSAANYTGNSAFGLVSGCSFSDLMPSGTAISNTANGLVGVYQAPIRTIISDCQFYRAASNEILLIMDSSVVTCSSCVFGGGTVGLVSTWSAGARSPSIINTQFIGQSTAVMTGSPWLNTTIQNTIFASSANALNSGSGNLSYSNCTFASTLANSIFGANAASLNISINNSAISAPLTPSGANLTNSLSDCVIRVTNKNSDAALQEQLTNAGLISRDNVTANRSPSAIKLEPNLVANRQLTYNQSIPGVSGVAIRIIGYLRFDTNYSTTTPPIFAVSGLGVSYSFTAPATANTWHKFDQLLTPSATGNLTISITAQSPNLNGAAWLTGVVSAPFITAARHYGFLYNNVSPHQAVDSYVTLPESSAAALSSIATLDDVFDASKYYEATTVPYVDLVSAVGTVADFAARNLVIDNSAGSAFGFATNTVTLKSALIAVGSKFLRLKTTGNITLNNNTHTFPADMSAGSSLTVAGGSTTDLRTWTFGASVTISASSAAIVYVALAQLPNTTAGSNVTIRQTPVTFTAPNLTSAAFDRVQCSVSLGARRSNRL
jgi:hypothetical protein